MVTEHGVPMSDPNNPSVPIGRQVAVDQIRSFAHWQDFVRDNFPWLEVDSAARSSFEAEVQSLRFSSSSLATIRSLSTEVSRTPHLAARSDAGYIKLMWQLAGALEVEQDQRRSLIDVGQACICDTARPYRVSLSDGCHFAVLTLPYAAIPGWERISQRLCGAPLSDATTANAALGALMGVVRAAPQPAVSGGDHVMQAVHWMLAASLHQSAQQTHGAQRDMRRLGQAREHILAHIDDPSLSPDELASALHMSRRALYLLFKEYRITPSRMIHDLRLERCRDALSDARRAGQSVTEIAYDHGFVDPANFSRLFKTQYGLSPSEWRRQALSASAG